MDKFFFQNHPFLEIFKIRWVRKFFLFKVIVKIAKYCNLPPSRPQNFSLFKKGFKKIIRHVPVVWWRRGIIHGPMIWRSGFDSSPTPDFSKIENHRAHQAVGQWLKLGERSNTQKAYFSLNSSEKGSYNSILKRVTILIAG